MDNFYTTITSAAIDSIEAMVDDPRDTVICAVNGQVSLAACVYSSWLSLVGDRAQQEDSDRMIFAIGELQLRQKRIALTMASAHRAAAADPLTQTFSLSVPIVG